MKRIGIVGLVGFIGCIFLANYAIQHWGDLAFPGGPHTVTIGPWTGPSGVLFVGASFFCRDVVQLTLGKLPVLGAIVVGAALSYLVAPSLAWASAAAFLVAELADFVAYTPLAERGRLGLAVLLSNTVGSAVDTAVFLWLAFSSLAFFWGQFWLKALMVLPALALVVPLRVYLRRRAVA